MAKRKTIRVNPLDTLVPDPTTRQTGEPPAAAKAQSADPATGSTRTTTPRNQPKAKDSPYHVSHTGCTTALSCRSREPHPVTGETERVHQVAGRWRDPACGYAVADQDC